MIRFSQAWFAFVFFFLQAILISEFLLGDSILHAQTQSVRIDSLWTRKTGEDWPEFLGKNRDGKSNEKGILTDWDNGKLKIKWTRPLKESYGIGSVADGRYFQFDRVDDNEVLTCLNAETGVELWNKSYPTAYRDLYGYNGGPRTSPVIDNERVYTYGVAGELRCHSIADGKLIWKRNASKDFGVIQNFFGIGSTPIIFNDLIIAMVGGSPEKSKSVPSGALDQVVGNGSAIVAFDKLTGKTRYQFSDDLASYSSPVIAEINGEKLCFAFCRAGLICFEPSTGKQKFDYPWRDSKLESVNASNPVIVDDQVFISETYGPGSSLLKVTKDHYEIVWKDEKRSRVRAMQTHWNTAIHHEGFLYGSSGRHTNNAVLKCIDLKTGKEKWSLPRLTRSSLLYIDEHFICLTEVGRLFLFKASPEKFEVVTEIRLDLISPQGSDPSDKLLSYPCWAAPIVSHGLLYVRGDRHLICLDLIPEKKK